MQLRKTMSSVTAFASGMLVAGVAFAQATLPELETIGKPVDGAMGFQPAVTELAEDIHWLDNMLLVIITLISLFVVALLAYAIVRYNKRANPEPARFTHNTAIEIAWTLIPVVILIFIGAFSLPVLFKQLNVPEPDVTIKATGNQWYWSYDYADAETEFTFDALMLAKDELAEYGYDESDYLLATDNPVVVPVNKVVHMLVTASDVIHAWTIPSFGVKIDAVPGRLNETWFKAEKEGIYFGQCSELCGKDHAYMPIVVKVVSEEAYAAWIEGAISEFAGLDTPIELAKAN
ncbi:cytochrome c oxidase subunit II [Oceanomicrobium pacificus]|uniref:Cytochrome c oxidase subunit 2 n=1 Tax=Oceanomicrobium pacificus TaxID=2692916 RepID=A0A6B0TVY2_9RHOB|nr:cytochrome c oxidase subunit II [Oceanomicrobium pacificus]MXU66849.1 cytochrome c oxidase subunit II [Oceanomicrobium pacificus]